jgi:hypothetical protein
MESGDMNILLSGASELIASKILNANLLSDTTNCCSAAVRSRLTSISGLLSPVVKKSNPHRIEIAVNAKKRIMIAVKILFISEPQY